MSIYINGSSSISAQPFFGNGNSSTKTKEFEGDWLACVEPDYNLLLDPRLLRRMSRIIKMGMTTGLAAMKNANTSAIDAVITGTGFGCLEDTSSFLGKMVDPTNRMMNPTSFIQSTHNTVGSQISLHLKFNGYNNTFVHSGFAFENAIDDAILLINNSDAQSVLVGGIDELTKDLYQLLKRIQEAKNRSFNKGKKNQPSFPIRYGEGSTFFILSNTPNEGSVEIKSFSTYFKPTQELLDSTFDNFHKENSNGLVFLGKSGDSRNNASYRWIESKCSSNSIFYFKQLCGEYPTSSAFGLWLASEFLKGNTPENLVAFKPASEVLIYSCFENDYHSFIRLVKC